MIRRTILFIAAPILIFAWESSAGSRINFRSIDSDTGFGRGIIGNTGTSGISVNVGGDSLGVTIQGIPLRGTRSGTSSFGDRLFPMDMIYVENTVRRQEQGAYPAQTNIFNPGYGLNQQMNALSFYFSLTDGGGFGFRMLYDRRIKPTLGFNVSGEFSTFDGRRLGSLDAALPEFTNRVSIIGLFSGLQQRFKDTGRVVPRIGFGLGPIIRVDHQGIPSIYNYNNQPYVGVGSGQGRRSVNIGIPIPLNGNDFPTLSVSAGGYANAGLDVVVDEDRLYAINVDARYNLIRFYDSLGNPGDFGGPALYIGFGRRF